MGCCTRGRAGGLLVKEGKIRQPSSQTPLLACLWGLVLPPRLLKSKVNKVPTSVAGNPRLTTAPLLSRNGIFLSHRFAQASILDCLKLTNSMIILIIKSKLKLKLKQASLPNILLLDLA